MHQAVLYLEGRLEKSGRFEDIAVNAAEMEQAVKDAFGTTDLDAIYRSTIFLA